MAARVIDQFTAKGSGAQYRFWDNGKVQVQWPGKSRWQLVYHYLFPEEWEKDKAQLTA